MIDTSCFGTDSMTILALRRVAQHLAMHHPQTFALEFDSRFFVKTIHYCCKLHANYDLPQPTAMPVLPAGSKSSVGKQTGIIFFEYVMGLRSFNRAISWLYVFESKYRCFITALTARILASASLITVWSWSPKMMRIFDRFNRRTQWAAVKT